MKEDGEMSEQKIVIQDRKAQLVSAHVIYEMTGRLFVPAAASNRHVHLSEADLERLFGRGYALTPQKDLSQPGQYAAKETVTLVGPKGKLEKVRVLGPVRRDTQVEISRTDSFKLGVKPVVRMSGDVAGTPGIRLVGPRGEIDIPQGVIVAARHLHLSAQQCEAFGLHDGQVVSLQSGGERSAVLENVVIRSGRGHDMEVHVDTDEANAMAMENGEMLEVFR